MTEWFNLSSKLVEALRTWFHPKDRSVILPTDCSIIIEPGADVDVDIITVVVTGTPKLIWDESEDSFSFSKGVIINDGDLEIIRTDAQPSIILTRTEVPQSWKFGRIGATGNFTIQDVTNNKIMFTILPNAQDDAIKIESAQLVINDDQDDYDVRIKSNDSNRVFYVNAGTNRIGIRNASPQGTLHVDQESATGGIPVLYLDQGDVSEEMMQFACTIGVGNAIEAIGGKSLTTTHFVKVTISGGLTRYFPVGTIA